MSIQRWLVISASAVALAMLAACAGKSRHEVLTFFFDGVPPPDGFPTSTSTRGDMSAGAAGATGTAAAPMQFFPHTPYRLNQCQSCHDAMSGLLVRPVQEGLCLTCHARVVEEKKYVHGPVAVADCSLCHHYHGSPFPGLLLTDPIKTCLNCHDQSDLTEGAHHAQPDRSCTDCHDAHGGENRFFVKRVGP